jgi:hypothetical protein
VLVWASAAQFSYKVSRKSFVSKVEIGETRTHARTQHDDLTSLYVYTLKEGKWTKEGALLPDLF